MGGARSPWYGLWLPVISIVGAICSTEEKEEERDRKQVISLKKKDREMWTWKFSSESLNMNDCVVVERCYSWCF